MSDLDETCYAEKQEYFWLDFERVLLFARLNKTKYIGTRKTLMFFELKGFYL